MMGWRNAMLLHKSCMSCAACMTYEHWFRSWTCKFCVILITIISLRVAAIAYSKGCNVSCELERDDQRASTLPHVLILDVVCAAEFSCVWFRAAFVSACPRHGTLMVEVFNVQAISCFQQAASDLCLATRRRGQCKVCLRRHSFVNPILCLLKLCSRSEAV